MKNICRSPLFWTQQVWPAVIFETRCHHIFSSVPTCQIWGVRKVWNDSCAMFSQKHMQWQRESRSIIMVGKLVSNCTTYRVIFTTHLSKNAANSQIVMHLFSWIGSLIQATFSSTLSWTCRHDSTFELGKPIKCLSSAHCFISRSKF